jgi:cyclin-dependent kinase 8/11
LGATFAQFFTPLRLSSDDTDDDDDHDCDDDDDEAEGSADGHLNATQPFIVPKYLRIGYPGSQWSRDTLFNGDRGEIGLAWSIFKIYGTPTPDNWPVSLPPIIPHFIP